MRGMQKLKKVSWATDGNLPQYIGGDDRDASIEAFIKLGSENLLSRYQPELEVLVSTLLLQTLSSFVTVIEAKKVVGWARNHYLSSCLLPSIDGHRLTVTKESLEIAIMRLKEYESTTTKPSHNLKNFAKDKYESNFISVVVPLVKLVLGLMMLELLKM